MNVENLSNLDLGSSLAVKGLDVVSLGLSQAAVAGHFRFSLVIEPEASTAPDFSANLNCAGILNPSLKIQCLVCAIAFWGCGFLHRGAEVTEGTQSLAGIFYGLFSG